MAGDLRPQPSQQRHPQSDTMRTLHRCWLPTRATTASSSNTASLASTSPMPPRYGWQHPWAGKRTQEFDPRASQPNLHPRWLPTRAPPQPLCVPQTLPCATVRTRWSSGPIGPCWAGYASLWRVSAAGSSTHARDVGVVARCVVARCGAGAAFQGAGSVGVPVVELRSPCCRASFVLAAGPL